jgi:anti-sigma B factor antagonist
VGLAGVPPPATWSGRELERENGRGLELMRTLADEFALSETPGGGLTVTLRYMIRENVTERLRSRAARGAGHGPKGDTMELQVETQGGVDVIHVAGRLDLVGATALKEEIRRRLQQHPQVVLNLKKVDFINSSGLGALVSILKDIRLASGRLVLSNLAPYVKEIFAITQLSNVFEIYADEEQARETFAGPVTV